jgi:hypothetical protein
LRRVDEDGRCDGHALEDVLELGARGDGGVSGSYGLDEAVGPGGVGGEVEELVMLLVMRKKMVRDM